jgi:hypothetical protein
MPEPGGSEDSNEVDVMELSDKERNGLTAEEYAQANGADPKLLSTVRADLWENRQVIVKAGKYVGSTGTVLRSGNGWVQVQTDAGEIAKRAHELELLEQLSPEDAAKDAEGNDGDGEDSKRSRRLSGRSSYAISWVRRKVTLPDGRTGTVRKAERGMCTVDVGGQKIVMNKSQLKLLPDTKKGGKGDDEKADRTPKQVAQHAYRERVKKIVLKQVERLRQRPNL